MDTTAVALKSLGNAVHTISEEALTREVLRDLGAPQTIAQLLGTGLRRCAYGNDIPAEEVEAIKALRLALLNKADWDQAVSQLSLGATLAHTADALFEARHRAARAAREVGTA